MTNGRTWSRNELDQIDQMLATGSELRCLATKIDHTPEAILVRAHKVLKRYNPR